MGSIMIALWITTCIVLIPGTTSTRPTLNSVITDIASGGGKICPYCSLCSYTRFCDNICLQRPLMACFLCQFRNHCQTTCKTTCKQQQQQDPCTPNPCSPQQTCEKTAAGKHLCSCTTPACLNQASVIIKTDASNPV